MKYLILIVSIVIGSLNLSFAGVSYGTTLEVPPPVEKNVRKKEQRIKKRLFKKKRKPHKINSPRIGLVYMIIGIVVASVALIAVLLILALINPLSWVLFLIPGVFFISGLSMII